MAFPARGVNSDSSCGTCPLCGTRWAPPRGKAPEVRRCPTCGLGYTCPSPSGENDRAGPPPSLRPSFPLRAWSKGVMVRLLGRRAGWLLGNLPPPEGGGRALDVGCGWGHYVRSAARLGWFAVGVERDARRLRVAHVVTPSLVLADAGALPFGAGQYHLVTLWHVLEHLPAPRQALEEARRILAPGGVLLLEVPHPLSLQARLAGPRWLHWAPHVHYWHFTRGTLRALVEAAGFRVRALHSWPNAAGWCRTWGLSPRWDPVCALLDVFATGIGRGGVLRLLAVKPCDST